MTFQRFTGNDVRSLALVLGAILGNAEVFGLDLFLFLFFPVALLFQANWENRLTKLAILLFVSFLGLTALAQVQALALDIPYSQSYWLWPTKSLLLALAIIAGPPLSWSSNSTLLLAGLSLFLVLSGSIVGGRLYSLLGPNMLYRVFGLLLFINTFHTVKAGRAAAWLRSMTISVFAILSLMITGSTGALAVIALIIILWLSSLRRGWKLVWLLLVVVAGPQLFLAFAFQLQTSIIFSRLLYKLERIDQYDRFVAWAELFGAQFRVFGGAYTDFSHIWFEGLRYPHNLFAELYAFYGIPGVIFIGLTCVAALISTRAVQDGRGIVAATFLTILLGALLSGDLSENFAVLPLALFLVALPKSWATRSAKNINPETELRTCMSISSLYLNNAKNRKCR